MQPYHRILMAVAAVALVGAGALLLLPSPPPPPPPPPPQATVVAIPTSAVLVAKSNLTSGQFLREGDFAWKDRPNTSLRPGFYLKGADSTAGLIGSVVLHPVQAGEAIQRSDVVSPRERGFLAAVLAPDKRSISVAVDDVTGSAGLILPGDRVDVIVTRTGPQSEPPARQVLGEVVLEDLRVIAVDQNLRGPSEEVRADAAKDDKPGAHPDAGAPPRHQGTRTVTMEVSQHEAEVLAVAANLGRLTLALRSLSRSAAGEAAEGPTTVWAGDVMHSLNELGGAPAPAQEQAPAQSVIVLRGGGQGNGGGQGK